MKQEIREQILYQRAKQSPDEKKVKDSAIIKQIEALPEFQNAQELLFYSPIHGEVDLTELFNQHKKNKKFILPRVLRDSKELMLYHVTSLEDLEKGSYSIAEPKEHLDLIAPEKITCAIIPGVAFAQDGHRIGYGGGFYDRLLPRLTCPTIGVAYQFQIVENIAGEKHDQTVHMIITETETVRTSSPKGPGNPTTS